MCVQVGEEEGEDDSAGEAGWSDVLLRLQQQPAAQGSDSDDEDWEEAWETKVGQLRGLLSTLDLLKGAVHVEDNKEIDRILEVRGVGGAGRRRPSVKASRTARCYACPAMRMTRPPTARACGT